MSGAIVYTRGCGRGDYPHLLVAETTMSACRSCQGLFLEPRGGMKRRMAPLEMRISSIAAVRPCSSKGKGSCHAAGLPQHHPC